MDLLASFRSWKLLLEWFLLFLLVPFVTFFAQAFFQLTALREDIPVLIHPMLF